MGRRLAVQVAAAVAVGAVLGVALHTMGVGASSPWEPGAEVAGATLERSEGVSGPVADAVASGVLLVEAAGCGDVRQASATVVRDGDDVVVMTNAHVVRGSGTVTLHGPDGTVLAARVLGTTSGRDAAVLRIDGDAGALGALPVGPAAEVGDELIVAGHPEGSARAEAGRVTQLDRRSGFGGSSDVLIVDAPVVGGSSGGAVLDRDGRVVGLVAAKDPATGWAVAYPIRELLGRGLGPIPTC